MRARDDKLIAGEIELLDRQREQRQVCSKFLLGQGQTLDEAGLH
jgi:hypothetical protein